MDERSFEKLLGSPLNLPSPGEFRVPRDITLADTMHNRIELQLQEFQEGLAPNEEIGICLANFGREQVIFVESVGFHNPHLVTFDGTNEKGHRVRLVQHMSQVSLLLVAVPARQHPARRVGFGSAAEK